MSYVSAVKMRKAASILRERCAAAIALIDKMETAWADAEALEEKADALERRRYAREICDRPIPHIQLIRRRIDAWDILELMAKKFMVGAHTLEALTDPLEALRRMCTVEEFDGLPGPTGYERFNPNDTPAPPPIEMTAEELEYHARIGQAMADGVDWESWPEVIARKKSA